jgi:hypothetical protein
MAWLRRFGLHLAAAVGAAAIFVAAVSVGAQTQAPAARSEPAQGRVIQERSLAGTVLEVAGDEIVIQAPRGRHWRVQPFPGALIRVNNRQVELNAIQVGDRAVMLGQVQTRDRFMAHAITVRRR